MTAAMLLLALAAFAPPAPQARDPGHGLGQDVRPRAPAPPPGAGGHVERHLFPPELIMRHQDELALTSAQRDAIKREIQESQAALLDVQWEMEGASRRLAEVLESPRIDVRAARAQLERVLELENRVKTTQLTLLIAIKNQLTTEQQETLRRVRPPAWPGVR